MKVPTVDALIERRLLVNYRVDPGIVARLLPAPFRPKLTHGYAIAGICLIRLAQLRPHGLPARWGLRSENAAHRIAVEWEQDGRTQPGVFIPRRDSNARLNTWLGGRLFPGHHHPAAFSVAETSDHFDIAVRSADRRTHVAIRGRLTHALPHGSVFASLAEASDFFQAGAVGYSATGRPGHYDGLRLAIPAWHVKPLIVDQVASSFFDDPTQFPTGAAVFDCALVMRQVLHSWHTLPGLTAVTSDAPAA